MGAGRKPNRKQGALVAFFKRSLISVMQVSTLKNLCHNIPEGTFQELCCTHFAAAFFFRLPRVSDKNQHSAVVTLVVLDVPSLLV